MGTNDYREGWGVVTPNGLDLRTVGPTRRSAIVNWLVTCAGMLVTQYHTDDRINAMWDANCGDAIVRPVRCYVQ